jgi:hypothetical protein
VTTEASGVNCIGIGFQRGTDTRWQLVTNDATGAPTPTDLGTRFPVASTTDVQGGSAKTRRAVSLNLNQHIGAGHVIVGRHGSQSHSHAFRRSRLSLAKGARSFCPTEQSP